MTCTALESFLMRVDRFEHPLRMAMGGVDDDHVDAGVDQQLGALEALLAHRGGRGDAQAALLVLGGIGMGACFSMSLTVIRPTQR